MSSRIEENKALIRRFFDAIESGDLHVFDQIVAHDYNDHLEGQSPGRESLRQYFTGLRSAFPDLTLPITAIVTKSMPWPFSSTESKTGSWPSIGRLRTSPRSCGSSKAEAVDAYRLADGKATEEWAADGVVAHPLATPTRLREL